MKKFAFTVLTIAFVLAGASAAALHYGWIDANKLMQQAEAAFQSPTNEGTTAGGTNRNAPARTEAGTSRPSPQQDETGKDKAPVISVAQATPEEFIERRLLTGSLVAREEIIVAPEVANLRLVAIKAEAGDSVRAGQILAELETETLQTRIAQNIASLESARAATQQAEASRAEAEAVLAEARKSVKRAEPLKSKGYLSESLYDQRATSMATAEARLASASSGLALARAREAELAAARRNLDWELSKTTIRAPVDGVISERNARIGQLSTPTGAALFRIIENGEIELEAEADDYILNQLRTGQPVAVEPAGTAPRKGSVRLVSPRVDPATRLGSLRVSLENSAGLTIGSFARGSIELARSTGLAVPSAAIQFEDGKPFVLRVNQGVVEQVNVRLGLRADNRTEVVAGLAAGDLVVAKSGTFLRDGDRIQAKLPPSKLSRATR